MKLILLLIISLFIISCNKSNEKRYLYFKNETSTKEFYLEGAKRKNFFIKKKPDFIIKQIQFTEIKKNWLEVYAEVENQNGYLLEIYNKEQFLFGGVIENIDEDSYKIAFMERFTMSGVDRFYYYNEEHDYTDSINSIPLLNQCWLELTDGAGITKIVWNGKSYVL